MISGKCKYMQDMLSQGRQVARLEYEAYEEMAEKEMLSLCKLAREKWNIKHIAIYHRFVLHVLKLWFRSFEVG